MSYRAFKRLLGETSLERKARFLLGSGVLVLMTGSFWVYAKQTEDLAYDQLATTGRALVSHILAPHHVPGAEERAAMEAFQKVAVAKWPAELQDYNYRLIKHLPPTDPRAKYDLSNDPEFKPDPDDMAPLNRFWEDPNRAEYSRAVPAESAFYYYGAIRAGPSCLGCHTDPARMGGPGRPRPDLARPDLKDGDLMAVVRIRLSTRAIEEGFHANRALLLSFAIGTSLLILAGSYLIIRYVIVKPVNHLKAVAEAIAGGELNVRSEIQTGDELEDLSHAFNRMLRNLTNTQDRNKKLIADLDRKVDELARVNMALYEGNRIKGDFLATMSHELRTPLNSIIGFSEVLLAAANLTEKQHRYAGNIMTGGKQLLALINDILELAKLEAGKMRLHPEVVSVADVCDHAAAMFRQQAEKKNLELRVQVAPDLPAVRQDPGKLHQILTNLLSNAVKFTPEGGRVTLKAAADGADVVFTVADTGVGIAPDEQGLVFEKFRQGANPMTREQGGSGLGLSIVRELAKLLGGDVTLHSDLGRGSTFAVRVAARLPDEPLLDFELSEEPTVQPTAEPVA